MLEGQHIRKRTHLQSSHELHHVNIQCPGGRPHLYLRGGGRAASSAKYPDEECRRIMMDGPIHNSPPDVSEGGSKHPILPVSFSTKSFEDKISVLQGVSDKLGFQKAWNKIVTPWLQQSTARMVMTNRTSEPSADTAGGGGRGKYSQVEGDLPHCPVYHPSSSSTGPLKENPASGNAFADADSPTHMRKTLQDLVASNVVGPILDEPMLP